MSTPEQILKQYWGYTDFRPYQNEIIASILNKKDTLALLPTGGGKSICYQVPALILDGVCLVISPLIALMQDQVNRLKELEIPAECIHSGLHFNEVKRILENAMHGAYKLLYISPERLQTKLFNEYLSEFDLSFIAIDEAHCVSQWGHDFRPDYLKIAEIRYVFPNSPILALTATATPDVKADIVLQLKMRKTEVFIQSFSRENLFFEVSYSENKSGDTLKKMNKDCSIIYCRSRKQTETTTKYLVASGIEATAYHAGMPKEKRNESQQLWMANKKNVMVATTAFGMGIDKPDVRLVLHYDSPEHIEAYYQEAGRAGRDGKKSLAITYYNSADIERLLDSIEIQFPAEAYIRKVYQSVAEYLQIAIGVQPDKYFYFDLFDFCKKFSFKATYALPALKILEQEGLWTLTEAVYSPATIQFITDRHVLDNLVQHHQELGYIIVGLLRMYNTIFHLPTPVRESAICKQLKLKQDELASALSRLEKMEILIYNKPAEGPQIFFHHCRADSNYLIIDFKRINALKKRHIDRTNAMIAFLENKTICREKIILEYFGEKPKQNCGHCDVCRSKEKQIFNKNAVRDNLLFAIKEQKSITIQRLTENYIGETKIKVLDLLREMIDDSVIVLTEDNRVCIE